jgi:hypothetical protein
VDSEEVPGRDETGPAAVGRGPHAAPQVLRSLDLGGPSGVEDQDDKGRMTGDCHVRFRGNPGMRLPRATRLLTAVEQMAPDREQLEQMRPALREMRGELLADYPEHVRQPLINAKVSDEWIHVGIAERGKLAELAAELRDRTLHTATEGAA